METLVLKEKHLTTLSTIGSSALLTNFLNVSLWKCFGEAHVRNYNILSNTRLVFSTRNVRISNVVLTRDAKSNEVGNLNEN
jgi:hypothetical protein